MFSVLPNFDLDPIRGIPAFRYPRGEHIPKIWVSHLTYDRRLFLDKPVIYIMRDPRDVIVSAYFHATRHKHSFEGDILSFIKDEARGAPLMCNYLNGWAKGLTERRSHILTYEALYADPDAELTKVLKFLGHPVDSSLVKSTVAAGNFSAMQALEKLQGIPGHTYDRNDTNSLRMRQGRPGAYDEHLNADALAAVEEICALNLSPAAKALVRRTQLEFQLS
jgi:alcohol sulfotransferase